MTHFHHYIYMHVFIWQMYFTCILTNSILFHMSTNKCIFSPTCMLGTQSCTGNAQVNKTDKAPIRELVLLFCLLLLHLLPFHLLQNSSSLWNSLSSTPGIFTSRFTVALHFPRKQHKHILLAFLYSCVLLLCPCYYW